MLNIKTPTVYDYVDMKPVVNAQATEAEREREKQERIGQPQVAGKTALNLMPEISKELNQMLEKLNVLKLFAIVPDWALSPDKNRKTQVLLAFLKVPEEVRLAIKSFGGIRIFCLPKILIDGNCV